MLMLPCITIVALAVIKPDMRAAPFLSLWHVMLFQHGTNCRTECVISVVLPAGIALRPRQ